MDASTMTKRGRVARALVAAALVAVVCASPAGAQTDDDSPMLNAAFNGAAQASAVFAPVAVNPNVDFFPVYSFSEIDNALSHGVSGGLWPGFLVDASFFQFGHQPAARALLGVAESLWPSGPDEDEAGTSDFAKLCAGGAESKFRMPAGYGDAAFPEPMMTGCQAMYTQYRDRVPWKVFNGTTESVEHASTGAAKAGQVVFGPVQIVKSHSTSATRVVGTSAVESVATVILRDVTIGEQLRIKEIRSRAVARTDGKRVTQSHEIKLLDPTFLGEPVVIDDSGVSSVRLGGLNDELAAQGFDVRLVQGETGDGSDPRVASATSGGLIVRMTREAATDEEIEQMKALCTDVGNRQAGAESDIEQRTGRGGESVDADAGANPLYEPVFPYNQAPSRLAVHETLPPSAPCVAFLFERSVDVGVSLAGSVAAARFQPLPAPPDLNDVDFGDDDFSFGPFRPIGGGFTPSPGGGRLPSYGGVPPVPRDDVGTPVALTAFGLEVSAKLKTIYGVFVLMLALLLAGRRAFARSIRS